MATTPGHTQYPAGTVGSTQTAGCAFQKFALAIREISHVLITDRDAPSASADMQEVGSTSRPENFADADTSEKTTRTTDRVNITTIDNYEENPSSLAPTII